MPRKKKATSQDAPVSAPPPPPSVTSESIQPGRPPSGPVVDIEPGETPVELLPLAESDTVTITNHQISLDLPLMVLPNDGYAKQRIDVRMSRAAAKGWKAYAHGLEKQEAKLESGKFVRDAGDAIRYMGEQIAGEL